MICRCQYGALALFPNLNAHSLLAVFLASFSARMRLSSSRSFSPFHPSCRALTRARVRSTTCNGSYDKEYGRYFTTKYSSPMINRSVIYHFPFCSSSLIKKTTDIPVTSFGTPSSTASIFSAARSAS